MDIFQIIIDYNPAWTRRELTAYIIIMMFYNLIGRIYVKRRLITISQYICIGLLISFIALVMGSTVFTRVPSGKYKYELTVFWSWSKVLKGNRFLLKENLLNMLMLVPMGVLLPFCAGRRLHWWHGIIAGALLSAVIETLQLVLQRGLFEFDDMIHNAIGCMIGVVIGSLIYRILSKRHR